MSFDFPNAPTNGQVFAPTGGPVYVYTGGVWKMQGSGQVVTAEARNRIVNGAMQISQETAVNTALTANDVYGADQWQTSYATGASIQTLLQPVVTPNGSKNRYRIYMVTADTSIGAGEFLQWRHSIEGIRTADFRWGTAAAKQVVLRFGFRGPAGTYSIGLKNSPATRTYLAPFTITAGQADIDTEQTFVIPGDTTGTWATDTSVGVQLIIGLCAGTTFQGVNGWQAGHLIGTSATSNGMGVVGNNFQLFDVGLYLDPNATGVPPPWQMPDEAAELAACQRYWQKNQLMGIGYLLAGTSTHYTWLFPCVMRIAPAQSYNSVTNYNTTGPVAYANDQGTFGVYFTSVATGLTGAAFYGITNARM
jgi:hypothetical protein